MNENIQRLREGYQPSAEIEKRGYQPAGPPPQNPTPPKVGSAAVKPVQPQTTSDNGQKK
jgi:hypothetical protein